MEDQNREAEQNINVIIQLNGYGSNSNADVEILPRLTQSPRGFNPPHILYNNVAYTDDVRSHNLILTPIHTYLGELNAIGDNRAFVENSIHRIPVIFLKLHLVPNQVFPIIAYSESIQHFFEYVITRKSCKFGVSYQLNTDGQNTFGTIAEIFEYNRLCFESFPQPYSARATGRQRFKILSATTFPDYENDNSIKLAKVKILPNIKLSTHPNLMRGLNSSNHRQSSRYYKKGVWQTPWPNWVYHQFDANHLASLILKKINILFKNITLFSIPSHLSFELMRLGLFNLKQINFLLGIDSTILRLQWELHYLNENQPMNNFICATNGCGVIFCSINDVFSVSIDGPHGIFCSQFGDFHSIITVTSLHTSLEFTKLEFLSDTCNWFYKYKGLKILCPSCLHHFGWRFIPLCNPESGFYALSLNAVKTLL